MIAALFAIVVVTWVLGAVRRSGLAGGLVLGVAFMVCFGDGPPKDADLWAAALTGALVFVWIRLARS